MKDQILPVRGDMNLDKVSGFRAESDGFFFGEEAEEYITTSYVKLLPGDKPVALIMTTDDFTLFDWSMLMYTRAFLLSYDDYEFTSTQWRRILDEGEKILSFTTREQLFLYMQDLDIWDEEGRNVALMDLKEKGEDFWLDRERFRMMHSDMCRWTDLVIGEDDAMYVLTYSGRE